MAAPTKPGPIAFRPGASSPGGGPHAWYDAQRARPSCVASLSMRVQSEIDAATPAAPNALYRYVWPSDTHPEAQDACKYTLPALKADGSVQASQPTNQKVVLPLGVSSGILIVAFDFYYTRDWKVAFTPIAGEDWTGYKFKTFQLTCPTDKIYFESRNLWGRARGDGFVSVADVRVYDLSSAEAAIANGWNEAQAAAAFGIYEPTGFCPTGERALPNSSADTGNPGGLNVPWGQWLRYYKEVQIAVDASAFDASWSKWRPTAPPQQVQGPGGITTRPWPAWSGPMPAGRYNMISEYIAGETFDPICTLDRVPMACKFNPDGSVVPIGKHYAEMNTSAHNVRHGDAIAYCRNYVAWRADRGLADDPSPLERPRR